MPVPDMVSPPVPLPIAPLMVVLPAPVTVSRLAPFETEPAMLRSAALLFVQL